MKSEHTGRPGHMDFTPRDDGDLQLPTLKEGPLPDGVNGWNITIADPEPEWPDTLDGRIRKWMYDWEDASSCYDPGLCFEILADAAKDIIEQLQAER